WNDELRSALCSLALLIPYYYILWLNKSRMGKKFSFSVRPMN
ncbi:MAG TPA: RseC/MucC family positive regulator of sigma(E), partial [Bacteroides uniformis]|nr:RseC/MucC family positive regulator of sigma(E) [Bacteroides uniformis]